MLFGQQVKSNIIATQKIHEKYGGVVPELASRAHQLNIVPVVKQAMEEAGLNLDQLDAIAFTQGPGLMGALHIGTAFAKSLSMGLGIPLIAVHHMQAHVLAHFIQQNSDDVIPEFPFLCLTVSGGHTQIVLVSSALEMQVVGESIDDAAGEAFDKAAKVLGLSYPGGPLIDQFSKLGDPNKFHFTTPRLKEFQYSFSGVKTNLLYFLRSESSKDSSFIEREMANICASYQRTLVDYLLLNFESAAKKHGVKDLALAGGVSANSELRQKFTLLCERIHCRPFIPAFQYCTDNAAMIGIAAFFKFQKNELADMSFAPKANWKMPSH